MLDIETIKKNVSTTPCFNGGTNFKTHYLAKTNNGYTFKPSIGSILFASAFSVTGLGFFCFGIYKLIVENFNYDYLFLIVFGAVFLSAGCYIFYQFSMPRVFDKRTNYYYKSFRKTIRKNTKGAIFISKIVAIQLIGETISGDKNSYKSFELNLVLDDATRVNVVDHGNLKKLIIDAEILSEFLNIPIWHAESNKT